MSRNPTRPTFDEARERREQDGTEYQLGAILTSLFDVPHHERKNYRPIGETQRGVEDTQDCATRDYINDLETQHNYAYRNRFFIPEVKKFLDDIADLIADGGGGGGSTPATIDVIFFD